jgi:hypothetical protein
VNRVALEQRRAAREAVRFAQRHVDQNGAPQ